jgi:hypothetical protein
VVGHLEPEDLRGADEQRALDPRRVGRQPALEHAADEMPQGAEPAQHRGDQRAHQRAVAIGQGRQRGMCPLLELLVERPLAAQHRFEDLGGDPARGEAGRVSG